MKILTPGFLNAKSCEGCNGTNMQMNENGLMRFCQECGSSYKKYVNKYGTDPAEHPELYITHKFGKPMVARIDPKKDYILLPNKKVIPLNS